MRDTNRSETPAANAHGRGSDRSGAPGKPTSASARRHAKPGPVLPATLATTDRKLAQNLECLEALLADLSAVVEGFAAGSASPTRDTRRRLGRFGKEVEDRVRLLDHRQRLPTHALNKSTYRVVGEIVAHVTGNKADKIAAAAQALDAGQPINEVAEILNLMIVE